MVKPRMNHIEIDRGHCIGAGLCAAHNGLSDGRISSHPLFYLQRFYKGGNELPGQGWMVFGPSDSYIMAFQYRELSRSGRFVY